MSFYDDILSAGDKRMDFDPEDVHKQDALKTLTFKAKSKPAKGLSLRQGCDFVRGKEAGTFDLKHKTEMRQSCHNNQWETTLTASNKDFKVQVDYAPDSMQVDGRMVSVGCEMTCTPNKNEWEANAIPAKN